jgi:hypothetical protein
MQRAATYQEQSRLNLAQAYEELDDLAQASEKAWGAAAKMVKAVAEQRGWAHDKHGFLHRAVFDLAVETGDADLRRLFSVANDLHTNFYENGFDRDQVMTLIQDVEQFVGKMERLLPPSS